MIEVRLFGQPQVKKSNEIVSFPFKKAEALFFYLCMIKRVNRNKALDLFWGEMPEQMARKSLRNAVYVIKKTLGSEIIYSTSRDFIELNSSEIEYIDIDAFNNGEREALELVCDELLRDFYVKDAEAFESWLQSTRQQIKEKTIERLQEYIKSCIKEGKFLIADKLCKKLIQFDEFNEEAYRLQMDIYRHQGEHGKCIEAYSCLSRILESELSLKPDAQTKKLFDEIMKERSKKTDSRELENFIFYGRGRELQELNDVLSLFQGDKEYTSIVIDGEMGIGKTTLIQGFIDTCKENELRLFNLSEKCCESSHALSSWQDTILSIKKKIKELNIKIDDIDRIAIASIFPVFSDTGVFIDEKLPQKRFDINNYRVVAKAISNVIIDISKHTKILMILEDINKYDEMSLSIIRELLYRDKNRKIFFVLTTNFNCNKNTAIFVSEMISKGYLRKIELKRFTGDEVREFIELYKSFREVDKDKIKWIFEESEGNPLFMMELLKDAQNRHEMPMKMKDIFRYKILSLSADSKKLIDIASAFKDSFKFEVLGRISGKDDFELISLFDELIEKGIIIESCLENGGESFKFVHHKLREFVYEDLYKAKQKLIHKKIADYYVQKPVLNYNEILYHYKRAGEKQSYLKYKIKMIFDQIEMIHEMFPVVKDREAVSELLNHKGFKLELQRELEEINSLYEELYEKFSGIEPELEIYYLNLMSRYYIISGKGEEGLLLTEKMIGIAEEKNNNVYVLKGYKLLIYHYINTKQIVDMMEVINKAIRLSYKCELKEFLAIFIRLKGVGYILLGQFRRGENFIKSAMSIFENFKNTDRYILNIMACSYYLGESQKYQQNYIEAISHYRKAIELSEKYGYVDRLTLFYSCLGQIYFEMGNLTEAEYYIEKAISLYEQFDFQWGRSIAWGYLALIQYSKAEVDNSLFCLEKADYYQQVFSNQIDNEILNTIKKRLH